MNFETKNACETKTKHTFQKRVCSLCEEEFSAPYIRTVGITLKEGHRAGETVYVPQYHRFHRVCGAKRNFLKHHGYGSKKSKTYYWEKKEEREFGTQKVKKVSIRKKKTTTFKVLETLNYITRCNPHFDLDTPIEPGILKSIQHTLGTDQELNGNWRSLFQEKGDTILHRHYEPVQEDGEDDF